ncbi:hypothetical protein C8F01DRAFT_1295424 [Mycena amicta]|nr:hypothetical protein C8F01DRAFT_1295424 [Mycena amicta]
MDVPHFPRELEREILEIAAETWWPEVPKLLLVAHRVHLWLEPFLYRSIRLGFPLQPGRETDVQEAFLSMASSKPPSFLARAVRRVIVDFKCDHGSDDNGNGAGNGNCPPELLLQLTEALRHCTGITWFAMNRCNDMVPAKIFDILDLVHLHRLSGFLGDIMPSPTPMDARRPMFQSLTHLSAFDPTMSTDPRFLLFLMTLPALTHLALNRHVQPSAWSTLLRHDGCMHLQLLVFPLMRAGSSLSQGHEQWANTIGSLTHDPRVVIAAYDLWTDYISVRVLYR